MMYTFCLCVDFCNVEHVVFAIHWINTVISLSRLHFHIYMVLLLSTTVHVCRGAIQI